MAPHSDDWKIPEDESEAEPAARVASSAGEPAEADRMRRIARLEVVRGWEAVGVDFSNFDARREHAKLYEWTRERKRVREAGTNKVWTTAIGAIVTAAVTGIVTFFVGTHR